MRLRVPLGRIKPPPTHTRPRCDAARIAPQNAEPIGQVQRSYLEATTGCRACKVSRLELASGPRSAEAHTRVITTLPCRAQAYMRI